MGKLTQVYKRSWSTHHNYYVNLDNETVRMLEEIYARRHTAKSDNVTIQRYLQAIVSWYAAENINK